MTDEELNQQEKRVRARVKNFFTTVENCFYFLSQCLLLIFVVLFICKGIEKFFK